MNRKPKLLCYLTFNKDPQVRAAAQLWRSCMEENEKLREERELLIARQHLARAWIVTCEEFLRSANSSIAIKLRKFLKEEQ